MTSIKRHFFNITILLAMVLVAAGCKPTEPVEPIEPFQSTDVTGANFAKDFQLLDHLGNKRSLADFKGKVVALFFGYIHCPDICPTTLTELSSVMGHLGNEANRVQVLFVTLDPARDTPEILAKFVPSFNPNFIGLYGTPDVITETAKEYKLVFTKQPSKTSNNYTLDHSAGTYIYDATGKLRLYASYGQGVDALVADIKTLLGEAIP